MQSAFGIDHGEFSKAEKEKASAGRLATGGLFPGFHAAAAGKKGNYHKLKAAGWEVGGSAVGTLVPGPGSLIGGIAGTHIAQSHGHYKKQT